MTKPKDDPVHHMIILFDKLMIGTFLEKLILPIKQREKVIKDIIELADKNKDKEIFKHILDFDFNSEIHVYEELLGRLCNMSRDTTIEYWNQKSVQALSPQPEKIRHKLLDNFKKHQL